MHDDNSRQNIGNGWWEARNSHGQVGRVPRSYFEICKEKWKTQPVVRRNSTPPRTSPLWVAAANGPPGSSLLRMVLPSFSCDAAADDDDHHHQRSESSSVPLLPSGRPVPPFKPPGLFARTSGLLAAAAAAATALSDIDLPLSNGDGVIEDFDNDDDDDFDDDDDDDDDEGEEWDDEYDVDDGEDVTAAASAAADDDPVDADSQNLDDDSQILQEDEHNIEVSDDQSLKQNSTPKRQLNRIAYFAKGGGDAYLFDMQFPNVPKSVTRTHISEVSSGEFRWLARVDSYSCSVMSPTKETKFRGMKSFIAYQLTPSFTSTAVSRRYKQFDWLQQRLVEKFSTIAIPPLPEKQIAGRFEAKFIRYRLQQLQLWIDRMCRHPVVAQSDVFLHFISCSDDKKWKAGKRTAERDRYHGGRFFQTVVAPSKPLNARFVEDKMDKFSRFVRSLDDSIRHLYCIGDANAKRHQDLFGKEFYKLGTSVAALSRTFSLDTRKVSQPLTKALESTSKTFEDIGKLYVEEPQHDLCHLLEGLNEYKGLLSTFPDILLVYRASTNKIQENAGMLTEAEIETVESRADVITYTVLAEMEHFQQNRIVDFQVYMQRYLHGQIAFYRQIMLQLQEALRQFDSI